MTTSRKPIACTLTPTDATGQLNEWEELHRHVLRTETVEGGAALIFDVALAERVKDLAAREVECCGFLSITTSRSGEELRLEVTSEDPEAAPVIALLTGASAP